MRSAKIILCRKAIVPEREKNFRLLQYNLLRSWQQILDKLTLTKQIYISPYPIIKEPKNYFSN
jgi:hypothetical protein